MKKPIFTGSAAAMITPFQEDGSLALDTLGRQIDRQLNNQTDALVLCATTGECATLSDSEWEAVITYALERADGKVPVIAGTGRNDTRQAVKLTQKAAQLGVQAALVVTPYYNKTTQAGLVRHYQTVAESADLPLILYNVPSRTGLCCSAESYAALAEHPNIYGVKEASSDFSLILRTRALCPPDFYLYSGNDDQIVPILSLGGQGVISTMANVIPKETHEICALWQAGEKEKAAALQIRCQQLIAALFREVNPIPVKAAMALLQLDSGVLRRPLTQISAGAEEELRRVMHNFGLIF